MAVALGKRDNAAAARDSPALRGLQAKARLALHFLDRPTHAFKSAPYPRFCLKARDATELFRGSLVIPVRLGPLSHQQILHYQVLKV